MLRCIHCAPVHDGEALLQAGHHVARQVAALLLRDVRHAAGHTRGEVDTLDRRNKLIFRKKETMLKTSDSAMMLGKMRSISLPAALGDSEPCTAFLVSSAASPNTARRDFGADFLAADTWTNQRGVLWSRDPLSTNHSSPWRGR